MERKTKTIIVITLCIAIVGLSVGYAALNSILNIAGNAKVGATAANWNISFKNVNCEAGGYAEAGSISSTGTTTTDEELVKNGLVSEVKYNNTNKDEIKIGDKLNK